MTTIKQIRVGATTYDVEDSTARAGVSNKVADVKINGISILDADKAADITITDGVASTSTTAALSANQGKVLNDRIDALSVRGRYLSLWNCATGLPVTEPSAIPYAYKSGDYYIVSVIGSTNLIPTGSSYTGTASATAAEDTVKTGDQYYYDGTVWSHIPNVIEAPVQDVTVGGASIVSGGTAVIPTASASVTGVVSSTDYAAFAGKQNAIPAGTSGNVVTYSGTAGTVGSLAVDSAATASSANLITSGAVSTAVAGVTPSVDANGILQFGA